MPSFTYEINNFASGILSPEFLHRDDLDIFHSGLKDAVNVIVTEEGSIVRRPGIQKVAPFTLPADIEIEVGSVSAISGAGSTLFDIIRQGSDEQLVLICSNLVPNGAYDLDGVSLAVRPYSLFPELNELSRYDFYLLRPLLQL